MASKDMCLIEEIPTLVEMGIDSLKIEGRLKTEYYLATVVRAYRCAIDEYLKLKQENRESEFDATKYLEELFKVKTRGMSKFYFEDKNNQDIHDFDGKSENLNYEYGAKVLNHLKDDLYVVEIKNKLSLGDTLEILYSDKFDFDTFKIEKLLDIKTKEEIDTINPGIKGQQVILKIPFEVKENTVLRRKK